MVDEKMNTKTKNNFVYFLGNIMYINITNLCTNNCVFCIRGLNDTVAGFNLWLKEEDNIVSLKIIEEIKANSPQTRDAVVFCGYGEPLIKLQIVKDIAKFFKDNYPQLPVRINTNGHANLIHKRNIVPELVGLIDKISVSLNAHNADLYKELTACKFDKELAYENVKKFINECHKNGIDVTATIVQGFGNYKIDIEKCKEIAEKLGAVFKVREWLSSGYK